MSYDRIKQNMAITSVKNLIKTKDKIMFMQNAIYMIQIYYIVKYSLANAKKKS